MRGTKPWLARAARAAAIVWTLLVVVAHSDAGVSLPIFLAFVFAGYALALWWAIGASLAAAIAWKDGDSAARAFRDWLSVPVLMFAAFVLVWSNLPFKTRLFFGGPALAQSADWFATLPDSYVREKRPWVGTFRIREFSQFGDELRFLTTDCGVVDTCGFVYSPAGRPPGRGEDSFEHLYGYWWHWHQSW